MNEILTTEFFIKDTLKAAYRNAISALQKAQGGNFEISTYSIECNSLHERFYTNDIRKSEEYKSLFSEIEGIRGPVLYWFEITSSITNEIIRSRLSEYQVKPGARKTPPLSKPLHNNSRILYVGKVKNEFWGRIITHLGYLKGEGYTQGLQLNSWVSELNLKLDLHLIQFDNSMADYMTILESSLAKVLKPIIGKHQ